MRVDINKLDKDHPIRQQAERQLSDDRSPTMERQRFVFEETAPGMNGDDGLLREHWSERRKRTERYQQLIKAQNPEPAPSRVTLKYIRKSTLKMDWDNLCASFKCWGDALVKEGVLEDDDPDTIVQFIPKWKKAPNYKSEQTIIEIYPYKPE